MIINLQKVNKIGNSYWHIFEFLDGKREEVETTKEDYYNLQTLNRIEPTLSGARWIISCERIKFDTPDGKLNDNQYADVGNDQYAKILGYGEKVFQKGIIPDSGSFDPKAISTATIV